MKDGNLQKDIYDFLHDAVYLFSVVLLVFVLLMRMVTVDGHSMVPTLQHADRLFLLSNTLYSQPETGDVVVAVVPSFNPKEAIVKRVVATEGQTVDIRYDETGIGTVYVDGTAMEEPYINEPMGIPSYPTISFPVTVPEGCVFVMGDNRNHSADGRYPSIGIFDKRYLLGKALLLVWPGRAEDGTRSFSRLGRVQ